MQVNDLVSDRGFSQDSTQERNAGGITLKSHGQYTTANKKVPSLSFSGRIRSINCALQGLKAMLTSQHNAWVHAAATLMVVLTGLLLGLKANEWCWITFAVISVWSAEALNTAFEFLTDVASPEFHPLAGKAKDVAAGAVLIAAIGAIIIGLLVLGPKISSLLF
jgi:diacylglycerol kinase (ATP)